MRYVIEHFGRLYKWSLIEYKHISNLVPKKNLIFTNIKTPEAKKKLAGLGTVYKKSFEHLNLKDCCILDPSANKPLTPPRAKKFSYLIFGGILGQHPRKGRTAIVGEGLKIPRRNLGKKQMATDNAVYVAKRIVEGVPIEKIKVQDGLKLKLNERLEVILPYRYVIVNSKPLISKELMQHIKKTKSL